MNLNDEEINKDDKEDEEEDDLFQDFEESANIPQEDQSLTDSEEKEEEDPFMELKQNSSKVLTILEEIELDWNLDSSPQGKKPDKHPINTIQIFQWQKKLIQQRKQDPADYSR